MSERRFGRNPGGVCLTGLHLVRCPTNRRRVRGGRVACRLRELLEQMSAERGGQIAVKEVMPDHLHVFRAGIQGPHRTGLTPTVPASAPAREGLWSPSYVVASVGYVSESTVRADYIAHQWEAVMAS